MNIYLDKIKLFYKTSKIRFYTVLENEFGDLMNISVALKILIAVVLGVLLLGLCVWLVHRIVRTVADNTVEGMFGAEYDPNNLTSIEPGLIGIILR